MSDIVMQTVVSGPAQPGSKSFRALYRMEFDGLSQEGTDYFMAKGKDIADQITKAAASKDVGDLSAIMTLSVDGTEVPPINVSGFSRKELRKTQRILLGHAIKLLDEADKHGGK